MRPHRRQPTRLLCLWDSLGKNAGVSCRFLLQCVKVKSESEVAQSCRLLATPWTAAYQAPPSMGFTISLCYSGNQNNKQYICIHSGQGKSQLLVVCAISVFKYFSKFHVYVIVLYIDEQQITEI